MSDVPLSSISGSAFPVGSDFFHAESGSSVTDSSGFKLRSGLYSSAASYPAAAELEHCKISGIQAVNSTSMLHIQSADNGAGIVVATFTTASSGQVLVSTDGGANFSIVATGLSVAPSGVVWNGSRFIIAGNDNTNFYSRYSLNGASWSAGGSVAGSSLTSGTVRLAYNGTVTYGIGAGSTVSNASAFTTTDGVTLTGRTAPTGSMTGLSGAGGAFLVTVGSASFFTSTDGVSFTTRTAPASVDVSAYLGGTWMLKPSASSAYYTTSNFIAFVSRQMSTPGSNIIGALSLSFDANRVYCGAFNNSTSNGAPGIWWSSDLISWFFRGVTASLGNNTVWHCQNGRYFFPKGANASAVILATANFTAADFVGAAISSACSAPTGSSPVVIYRKLAD